MKKNLLLFAIGMLIFPSIINAEQRQFMIILELIVVLMVIVLLILEQ